MYELAKLCTDIRMPPEVTAALLGTSRNDFPGLGVLRLHLNAACEAWSKYQKLGLSKEIYLDTMAAFSRFVREHQRSFGIYGFDRDFWTTRQTGCLLFRIGTLEYELCEEEGMRVISLHIPSDAVLTAQALGDSIRTAKEILERTFPDWAGLPWYCHSWLLSPDLKTVLPETSRILYFQSLFTLEPDADEGEFKLWAYGRLDIPDADLPEKTTLQRNLKKFLLEGNRFRSGRGTLKETAFP